MASVRCMPRDIFFYRHRYHDDTARWRQIDTRLEATISTTGQMEILMRLPMISPKHAPLAFLISAISPWACLLCLIVEHYAPPRLRCNMWLERSLISYFHLMFRFASWSRLMLRSFILPKTPTLIYIIFLRFRAFLYFDATCDTYACHLLLRDVLCMGAAMLSAHRLGGLASLGQVPMPLILRGPEQPPQMPHWFERGRLTCDTAPQKLVPPHFLLLIVSRRVQEKMACMQA